MPINRDFFFAEFEAFSTTSPLRGIPSPDGYRGLEGEFFS